MVSNMAKENMDKPKKKNNSRTLKLILKKID